jgi:putative ABC transport system permease protein
MARESALPLAWRKLLHDKPRLLLSAAGVTFAVVLMAAEVGFLNAMYDGQLRLLAQLDADIFVISRARYAMLISDTFPRRRLAQAREVEGVASACPLYVDYERPSWRNPDDGSHHPIRAWAFDPDDPVFRPADLRAAAGRLKAPDALLLDAKSRDCYGPRQDGLTGELSGHAVTVVGTFAAGPDFLSDGNVMMSDKTYLQYFASGADPAGLRAGVHLGLVRVAAGADPERVAAALRAALPDDVAVLTRQRFFEQEMDFWHEYTPIGYVFGVGAGLGFLVGVIICYQILYTAVADNLPQFATLKAIGYPDSFLVRVVLAEALLLALLGFAAGFAISQGLYVLVAAWTGLPMRLTAGRAAVLLVLTVAMCAVAGLVALRRVVRADPAEVF